MTANPHLAGIAPPPAARLARTIRACFKTVQTHPCTPQHLWRCQINAPALGSVHRPRFRTGCDSQSLVDRWYRPVQIRSNVAGRTQHRGYRQGASKTVRARRQHVRDHGGLTHLAQTELEMLLTAHVPIMNHQQTATPRATHTLLRPAAAPRVSARQQRLSTWILGRCASESM